MKRCLRITVLLAGVALCFRPAAGAPPNIIIFLADDSGYSDIGCYGSEIHTPNLDSLGTNGLRFTQFYNTARCSPTRASLMTGLYSWQAGIGHLFEDHPQTGYTPALNRKCVTLAEVLKTAGYGTYISGKWHIGGRETNQLPCQRGFDHFFGVLVPGGGSLPSGEGYYGSSYWLDNTFTNVGSGPYSTDRFTDHALQFLQQRVARTNAPFFLYAPFTAPHFDLTGPPRGLGQVSQHLHQRLGVLPSATIRPTARTGHHQVQLGTESAGSLAGLDQPDPGPAGHARPSDGHSRGDGGEH